ncbi:MAG: DNA repair protein RadC [Anaerolineales bacterium]|nr:DNA repair protein RadC [Anaerolineales bacterium]
MTTQISYLQPAPRLKYLPQEERPANRVIKDAEACNLVELLAAIVGGPRQIEIAEALLVRFGDLLGLYRAQTVEIGTVLGVGQSTAARLKAALAIGKRLAMHVPEERQTINSPADAAALVQHDMGILEQEHLRVIVLNTRNRVLDIVEIYRGSLNSAQVRVAEVFRPAIQRNAAAIIAVHNHPSQDPSPSPDDVSLTMALVQAGKNLDVDMLDHLIVAGHRWVSLKERKLGFDGAVCERRASYQVRDGDWAQAHPSDPDDYFQLPSTISPRRQP